MTGLLRPTLRAAQQHFWGVLLLCLLLIGSLIAVRAWKQRHPGAMTVLESQAMDMTVMRPPVGAVPVATEVVHRGPFRATVSYTGSVAPLQEQVIYPRVEGTLTGLSVYDGDHVAQGQLLATVESPDLQSRAVEAAAGAAAAESEVPAAQHTATQSAAERNAALGEVRAAEAAASRARAVVAAAGQTVTQRRRELQAARADAELQRAQIVREKKLLDAGAVSLEEYQAQKARTAAAEADLGSKRAMLEEARALVDAAEADRATQESLVSVARQRASAAAAALAASSETIRQKTAAAQQARAMAATAATISDYRHVRAPFSGTLTKRYVSPGQFVTPASAIASVVQIDHVRLQANVADRHVGSIRVGAPVTARFAKNPDLIVEAAVTSVSPLADQTSRTATVEAIVPNPGQKLFPGDAVTLEIAVSSAADAISVPVSAVVQQDGQPAVWVAQPEGAKGKTLYTCTMHPEVISDKPGDCPKCLMKLVPTKSGGNKKARLVMVRTGTTSGGRVEILSGLSDGVEVITRGNTYLQDGDTVFPTTWTESGPSEMPPAAGMEDMPEMDHGEHDAGESDTPPADGHSKMTGAATEGSEAHPMTTGKPLTTAPGQKVYVCPMHPGEMSHDPEARCRVCGMRLEEKQ